MKQLPLSEEQQRQVRLVEILCAALLSRVSSRSYLLAMQEHDAAHGALCERSDEITEDIASFINQALGEDLSSVASPIRSFVRMSVTVSKAAEVFMSLSGLFYGLPGDDRAAIASAIGDLLYAVSSMPVKKDALTDAMYGSIGPAIKVMMLRVIDAHASMVMEASEKMQRKAP